MATAVRPWTPAEIIRTAAAVLTMRGYYQPLGRPGEQAIPTALDVTAHLHGWEPVQRGDRARIARAAAQLAPGTVEAVTAWAASPPPQPSTYRLRLARLVRSAALTEDDVPVLASAVHAWQRTQQRAARAAQAETDRARSTHQGAVEERITRRLTVAAVVEQPSRTYGYRVQLRYLVRLRDESGAVYVWPAQPKRREDLPAEGQAVEARATVTRHETYQGTAQTWVTRVRWTEADQA
ncbi:hypothetical protein ABT357_27095 [Streptomyces albidoflavus]|uniref:hypothetical protein n=1 Tax=Streptomyces albidoflavus TaxID=1886 RepID=UPI003321057E